MLKGQKSVRGGIEDILIPMENFRCTQGDFEGNHPYYACDLAGKDGGQDVAYFPFTAICKATNPNDGNAVWYQSKNKVRFADGTIDYATIMVLHDNNLNGVVVGREYSQGSQMSVEGNKMGTTYGKIGNHLHFEIAKGAFTKQYAKNNKGYYLPNGQPIEKCCFADGTTFLSSKNWAWKYTKDVPVATNTDTRNYVNLPANVNSWAVYDLNVAPVKANAKGHLNPSKFGGLSYYVHEYRDNNTTAVIQTQSFGKVKIYIKGTPADVTVGSYKYGLAG